MNIYGLDPSEEIRRVRARSAGTGLATGALAGVCRSAAFA